MSIQNKIKYVVMMVSVLLLSTVTIQSLSAETNNPEQSSNVDLSARKETNEALNNVARQTLENEYLEIKVDSDGEFVIHTTGGDLSTPDDDNKNLMYGSSPRTSFTSVYVDGNMEELGYSEISVSPISTTIGLVTEWVYETAVITQTLSFVTNPYTGNEDTVQIEYCVTNNANAVSEIGVRLLNDVQIAYNDGAPYFVPGYGNITYETEFDRNNMPTYWRAFESDSFDPSLLRAQGIINGFGTTTPDRFLIVDWPKSQRTTWDYEIDPEESVTNDSATLIYWNPEPMAMGEVSCHITYYGMAGEGGNEAWVDAPNTAPCPGPFTITSWVANQSEQTWVNGNTRITLSEGLQLNSSLDVEPITQSQYVGDVEPNSDLLPSISAMSTDWVLSINPNNTISNTAQYTVTTGFDSGPDSVLVVVGDIILPECEATAVTLTQSTLLTSTSHPVVYLFVLVKGALTIFLVHQQRKNSTICQ